MKSSSVRTRLTLWNMGILTLLLVALGLSIRTIVRAYLSSGIDGDLVERAARIKGFTKNNIHYENGKFLVVRRGRDGKPTTRPLASYNPSGAKETPEEESAARITPAPSPLVKAAPRVVASPLPKAHPSPVASATPGAVPSVSPSPTPSPDAFFPRFLSVRGETLRINRQPEWIRPWDPAGIDLARVLKRHVFTTVTIDGERYRVITTALEAENLSRAPQGEIPGYLQVAFRLTDIERGLSALDRALLTLLPLSLLVAGASGAWLTGRAMRPVRDITLATDRIAAESLSGRLPVTGSDEFSELSRSFNGMLERLESSFERQRRFVADASHELRTPLAIVTANTSLALDDETPPTPEGARRGFVAIHGAANRMSRIVGDLLLLAQSDGGNIPMERKTVAIDEVLATAIEEAAAAHRQRSGKEGAPILPPAATGLRIKNADVHYLVRVFVNLIENALRHTPASGEIAVSAVSDNGAVRIVVQDTGTGISPEHLPRLFDRFYRVDAGRDRERGGTGLGLPIVQSLVRAHDGTIAVDSERGVGTTVTITLPLGNSSQ